MRGRPSHPGTQATPSVCEGAPANTLWPASYVLEGKTPSVFPPRPEPRHERPLPALLPLNAGLGSSQDRAESARGREAVWTCRNNPVPVAGGSALASFALALSFFHRRKQLKLPDGTSHPPPPSVLWAFTLPWGGGDQRRCSLQSPRAAPPILPASRPPSRTPSPLSPCLNHSPCCSADLHNWLLTYPTYHSASAACCWHTPSTRSGMWCCVGSLVQGCMWVGGTGPAPSGLPVIAANE